MGTPGILGRSQSASGRQRGHPETSGVEARSEAGSVELSEHSGGEAEADASTSSCCGWGGCCITVPGGAGTCVQVGSKGVSKSARCGSCGAPTDPPSCGQSSSTPGRSDRLGLARTRHIVRVLVLFSGRRRPGSIAQYLRAMGVDVTTYEIMDGADQDLTVWAVQQGVLDRVKGGEFDAIFLAPPCASFCFALRPVLRSKRQPLGRDGVPARWRAYLQKHNNLVSFSADVCLAAESVKAAWVIENPASRASGMAYWKEMAHRPTIWDMPAMLRLAVRADAVPVTTAQCQFGSEYQKYTTFLCSRHAAHPALQAIGLARCTCTSHAKVAKGYDEFGESLSAPAAAYPPQLCEELARILLAAAQSARSARKSVDVAQGLSMGSADPHELELNEVDIPRTRRAPTFALSAHEAASHEELLARPIPAFNHGAAAPAPSTDGETLPNLATSKDDTTTPPVVNCLEELLVPVWAKRLRTWERRARRCMRLARLGKWQAARRMRPPDLWVSAEASMLPGCQRWTWDLRPLALGLPAVPVEPSSYPQRPPHGSLDLAEVAAAAAESPTPDGDIVLEMLNGVSDNVQGERGSFLCVPHVGALQFDEQARARLLAGVEAGYATEHSSMPFWPLRCDPYSVVDESANAGKPKFRLTNDHSWPPPHAADGVLLDEGGRWARSLNGSMDRSNWPDVKYMRVRQMAAAIATLQTSTAPVRAGVMDVVAYYKNFGRQLDELWRNGSLTEAGYVVDERCCFGSAADAVKCSRASNFFVHHARRAMQEVDRLHPTRDPRVLAWLAERRRAGEAAGASEDEMLEFWTCMHAIGMYVDDASTASVDDELIDRSGRAVLRDGEPLRRADAHFEAVRAVFNRFGLTTDKEQLPSSKIILLGVEIDLEGQRMRLAPAKSARYADKAAAMAERKTCPRDEYLSLMGKLTFAATCFPRGRQWLHAPWRAARARYRTRDGSVILSAAVRKQLRRWVHELRNPQHEGVPLASTSTFPSACSSEAAVIYADAAGDSATAGYCAWTVVDGEFLFVEGRWTRQEREHLLICDLELAASTIGLVALQPLTGRRHVYSYTDNTVAMAAMRGLVPSTSAMQWLTAERVSWMLENEISEATERITSKANLWADMGSRARVAEMLEQATQLGLTPRRVDEPAQWRRLLTEAAAAAAVGGEGELRAGSEAETDPAGADQLPPPLSRNRGVCAGDARGADREGARVSAYPVPQLGGERSSGWSEVDRGTVVAQVLHLRPQHESSDALDGGISARGQARGGAAAHGLRHMAGDLPTIGEAGERQVDRQVHLGGASLAPSDDADAPDGRPRLLRDSGPHQGPRARAPTAGEAAPVGRADAGPGACDSLAPIGSDGVRLDVDGDAVDGILRPPACGGGGGAGGRGLRPAGQPDARGHLVQGGREGQRVHGPHGAASQAVPRSVEGSPSANLGRREPLGPGSGHEAHAGARPGAGARACEHPALPARAGRDHGRPGAVDGQGAHAVDRVGRATVRCSLPADRRGYGGACGGPQPGHDQGGGPLVERHLPHLLPHLQGVGSRRGDVHRLDALRGPREGRPVHWRGAGPGGVGGAKGGRALRGEEHDRRPVRRGHHVITSSTACGPIRGAEGASATSRQTSIPPSGGAIPLDTTPVGTRRRSLGEQRARPQGWGRALSAACKQHGELGSEGVKAAAKAAAERRHRRAAMETTTTANGASDSRVLRSGAAVSAGDGGARVAARHLAEAAACGNRLRGTLRQRGVQRSIRVSTYTAASDDGGAARRGRRVSGGDGEGAKVGARRGASVVAAGGVGGGWAGVERQADRGRYGIAGGARLAETYRLPRTYPYATRTQHGSRVASPT